MLAKEDALRRDPLRSQRRSELALRRRERRRPAGTRGAAPGSARSGLRQRAASGRKQLGAVLRGSAGRRAKNQMCSLMVSPLSPAAAAYLCTQEPQENMDRHRRTALARSRRTARYKADCAYA